MLLSLAAPAAGAAPVALEFRAREGATELVIPGIDVGASTFRLEPCAAVLRVTAPAGIDLDRVRAGTDRIRGVALDGDSTLRVETECGAGLELRRRAAEVALVVGAAPIPQRKPGAEHRILIAATGAPISLVPPASDLPNGADAAAAAGTPANGQDPDDAGFARAAIAAGIAAADEARIVPPVSPPGTSDAGPSPSERASHPDRPDPAWARQPPIFKLAQWQTSPFRAERDRLRDLLEKAPDENARRHARVELGRLLLAWDMGPEALDLLTGEGIPSNPEEHALAAAAAVLANADHEGADWFATPEALARADGPLWAAAAAAQRGQAERAVAYLPAAHAALGSVPKELRRRFGLELLGITAAAGLDGFAREMAQAVELAGPDIQERALLHLRVGDLHATAGRAGLALDQWDRAAALSGDAALTGKMRAAGLRYRDGDLDAAGYRMVLEGILRERRGGSLDFDAMAAMSMLERAEGRVPEAVSTLRLLALRYPHHAGLAEQVLAAQQMLEGLVAEEGGLPLADRIATFEAGRLLLADDPSGWQLRRRYASFLVRNGFPALAREELLALSGTIPPEQRQPVILDLAALDLSEGDPERALATLALDGADEPDKTAWAVLKARVLTADGKGGQALELVADITGSEAQAARADSHWQLRRWKEAAESYKVLAGLRPLSGEEATRQGLAGYLAGGAVVSARDSGDLAEPWAARLRVLAEAPTLEPATDAAVRALLRGSRDIALTVPAAVSK